MSDKYFLQCPKCGASVLSPSSEMNCYKCETKMTLIGEDKKDARRRTIKR